MSFEYEILEHIATLSTSKSGNILKELNVVSYRGQPPKFDIRAWRRDSDGERPLRGVTLDNAEFQALKEALASC